MRSGFHPIPVRDWMAFFTSRSIVAFMFLVSWVGAWGFGFWGLGFGLGELTLTGKEEPLPLLEVTVPLGLRLTLGLEPALTKPLGFGLGPLSSALPVGSFFDVGFDDVFLGEQNWKKVIQSCEWVEVSVRGFFSLGCFHTLNMAQTNS
jgi:hypothetical protein